MSGTQRLLMDLRHLNRGTGRGWTAETCGKAPHKPLMLLAVADLIEAGVISENRIPCDERLLTAFDQYWIRCCPSQRANPLHCSR